MAAVRGVGFSSAVIEDIHFDQLRQNLDEAEELGVDFVELPLFAMDLIAGGRVLERQMRRLRDALKARSLAYTVHGPISINFMQTPEIAARHLALARAVVEVAADIGAPHLVLHAGHTTSQTEAEIEAQYARQREAFAEVGELAAKHGIAIAVENIFVSGENQRSALPSRLAREIEAIGCANVKACLDFSHAAIASTAAGADFLTEAKALATRGLSPAYSQFRSETRPSSGRSPARSASPSASATCTCPSAGAIFPGGGSWRSLRFCRMRSSISNCRRNTGSN